MKISGQGEIGVSRQEFLRLGAVASGALLLAPNEVAGASDHPAEKALPTHPTDRFQRLKQSMKGGLTLEYRIDDGSELVRIGQWLKAQGVLGDTYGQGQFIEDFESKIAAMLGKEAAVFLPTGVMGMLTAMRIYADRSSSRKIGLHPTSHHLLHEEDAYKIVHQLDASLITPWDRPILAEDLSKADDLCAVSVEMPVRWLGGQLQTWDQLQALKAKAAKLGIPLMMDGARLWEVGPAFGKSFAEICEGFDSVFVSFYKMIGALNGAVLAGSAEFIQEARVWRRRLGGDVYQMLPYVASSAMRLDPILPKLEGYRQTAQELARRLTSHPDIIGLPAEPPTSLFRIILPGDRPTLMAKRDEIAGRTGIWVGDSFRPTRVPGLAQVELQVGPFFEGINLDAAQAAFFQLLE